MKRNAIIRIVIYALVIAILIGILVAGIAADGLMGLIGLGDNDFHTPQTSSGLTAEVCVDAQNIHDIEIEWVAGSITIEPGETDTIQILEAGARKESEQFVWRVNADELTIQYTDDTILGIHSIIDYGKDLTIKVPADWVGKELKVEAVSAQIDVNALTCTDVDLETVSGECTFTSCIVDRLSMETVSGNISYQGSAETIETDAVSASIDAILLTQPKSITMEGVSGDMTITLPDDSGFAVELDTASGDFTSDFPTTVLNDNYIVGDGECQISISGASGDVTIKKAQ